MGWTLSQVRSLEQEEFEELLAWIEEKNTEDDSIDADAIVSARREKDKSDG